jgi:hypothetical protein
MLSAYALLRPWLATLFIDVGELDGSVILPPTGIQWSRQRNQTRRPEPRCLGELAWCLRFYSFSPNS